MLDRITQFSLSNRLAILVMAVLLVISGTYFAERIDIDIFPELTAPTVVIMTEAAGMAPEEVEKLISYPVETSLNGSTGVRRVRSNSSMGFSVVWVEFDWGTDIYKARQTVTERLFQVNEILPEGVDRPVIAPQTSLLGEIMIIAMVSDSISAMDLKTIADWTVTPRLLSVGGVAQVNTIGGETREYQILADPRKMNFYGVTLNELKAVCENINNNTSGGFINEYGNKYIIRGIVRTANTDEIAGSVIKVTDRNPVRIKDVAEVTAGSAPAIGTGSYRGKNAVLVTVTKQPDANTVKLTKSINKAIAELQSNLGDQVKFHTDVYNQSDFIKTAVNNVLTALVEGGIFVMIILFFFLFNFRTTFISLVAIPLSLFVTILIIRMMGLTINTMSLGGMTIAVGSLVDDAIIYVENSFKQLRINIKRSPEERENPVKVIFRASSEMRSSILNATLIIIITFSPLFFLEGLEARMLKPLGLAFIISLFASLLVAISLTPVLSSFLLTSEKQLLRQSEGSWTERKLGAIYRKILHSSFKRNKIIVVLTGIMMIIALILLLSSGTSFLPPFNEGALTVNISAPPGISLDESARIGRTAEEILLKMPEVKSISRKTGRAELAEHSFGENVSELDVPFELKTRNREAFYAEVRKQLSSLHGTNIEVGQPVTHRIDNMLSGSKANIAIKIFGDDINELYHLANEVKNEITDVEGIGDLTVEQLVETPQIKIKAKREMLARYGIPVSDFASFVEYAIGGRKVSDVYEEEKRFPLVLRYKEEVRSTMESLRNIMIDTYDGRKIPLSFVADIESSYGPNAINRENVRRRIVVSVNVAGRDIGSVVKDIRKNIEAGITLPEGYSIQYGGQFETAETATKRLLFVSFAALLIIFAILYYEFRNATHALIILLNLPLALIGGILAIKFTSNVVSIPSIIGFITLFGIATRNGILLLGRYNRTEKISIGLKERIIEGSVDRLNPILMTALTAALALIPLATGGDKPGNEIQSPMAIVILGGLLSSTLLNLIVVPSVYYLTEKNRKNDEKSSIGNTPDH